MIVQLTGNVTYDITLDPTVWIFDDRKILLEDAFSKCDKKYEKVDASKRSVQRWSREVYQQKIKPPVNKSITRFKRESILKNSYIMPIKEFLSHAMVNSGAQDATLVTFGGDYNISLQELQNSYLLFAIKGKPLKDNGPVHLYFKDGSNKDAPYTGVKEIIIN